jgi:hypothetical protein
MWRRPVAIASLTGAVTACALLRPDWLIAEHSHWFFIAYAALSALLLGWRAGLVFIVGLVALTRAAESINETKIQLTQLPLTVLDFEILAHDPRGLLSAMKLPGQLLWVLAGGAVVCGAGFLVWLRAGIRRVFRDGSSNRARMAVWRLAALMLLAGCFGVFTVRYVTAVHQVAIRGEAWEPRGLADLSRRLGVVGFLLYSASLERRQTGDFFDLKITEAAVPAADIRSAASARVHPRQRGPEQRPNIVVLLAESTFDVNLAFKLSRPVRNTLFESNAYTRAKGPLVVNAVGGGTWLSEFESIVGVDSRLFGYSGYYTHSSLAPFVQSTLATYLENKGYFTAAYYPTDGDFYNGRRAYSRYGFERFKDAHALGLLNDWTATDQQIAAAAMADSAPEGRPFLKYVLLLGNHAPHRCVHFQTPAQLETTFAAPASFGENCVLNEFDLLARSTAAAVDETLAALERAQAASGRPFVLLVFGDHQPHTFTATPQTGEDRYARFRTSLTPRHTFFHLMASEPDVVQCCDDVAPHLTLLPTLLSAYVADGIDDLYLPVNLLQFRECGSDFMRRGSERFDLTSSWRGPGDGSRCSIYSSLVSTYRSTGTFSF